MYGLKQAARIAFDRLVKLIKPNGYYLLQSNHVIWCHETLPTKYALCVDNSEIKYTNPTHAHHLVNTLQKYYKISIDWEGGGCCGLTLDLNYDRKYVDVSIPVYIAKALHKF